MIPCEAKPTAEGQRVVKQIFLFWIYLWYGTVMLPKDILHKFSYSNYAGMVGNCVTPCRPMRSNDQSIRDS